MALIECRTKFTKDTFRKIQYFYLLRGDAVRKILTGFMIICFVIGPIMMIAAMDAMGILLGAALVSLALFYLLFPVILTNSMAKSSPAMFDYGIVYSFFEDHFVMTTTSDLFSSVDTFRYEALFKVTEAKDCFYLYLFKMPSLIVSKDGFTTGTPEELVALLTGVLPPKKFLKYMK